MNQDIFPFINSKTYVQDLVLHVAVKKPKVVMVVIGLRTGVVHSYCNTEGTVEKIGYIIVKVNLKSISHYTNKWQRSNANNLFMHDAM